MRRLLLLVLAGCGFDAAAGDPVDAPRSDVSTGDPDAPAVDAALDASIDGPATPGDGDGDGIPDATDNCPTIGNADQHNEDGDPRGDACDPCPYIASATLEVDSDGDGIGDICDPHPAAPDVLVLFDPFKTDGPISPTWVHSAGTATWSVSGGALRVAAGTGTEIIRYPTTARPHTIDLGVRVDAVTGGGSVQQFVTAMTDVASDIGGYFGCGYRFDPPRARELFAYDSSATPQFVSLGGGMNNPPTVPGTFRIRLQAEPNSQICSLTGQDLVSTTAARGNPSVGIRARNVTLQIHYVAIYRSP